MIVDTSALVAILADEPEAATFRAALARYGGATVSSGTWIEFATVLVRKYRFPRPQQVLNGYASGFSLVIAPVTGEQVTTAVAAYAEYGRGSGHLARLNFGDCFSYALAKATGEPLLFKGDDFIYTDVTPALPA